MDEVWDRSPIIAYGRIVALELSPTSEQDNTYLAVVRIERSWKGELKPRQEILVKELLPDAAGRGFALQFNRTYVLQLARRDGAKTFERTGAQDILLPIPRELASPVPSVFGETQSVPFLTWVEYLERRTGNIEEANRIRKLRGQDALDKQASETKEKIFATQAIADFRAAMDEKGIAERMTLLQALLKRVRYKTEDDMVALTAKINAELSLGATYLSTGRKTFPDY